MSLVNWLRSIKSKAFWKSQYIERLHEIIDRQSLEAAELNDRLWDATYTIQSLEADKRSLEADKVEFIKLVAGLQNELMAGVEPMDEGAQ